MRFSIVAIGVGTGEAAGLRGKERRYEGCVVRLRRKPGCTVVRVAHPGCWRTADLLKILSGLLDDHRSEE